MNEEYHPGSPGEMRRKGRRTFWQLAVASLVLGAVVTAEEFFTWNIPGFAFGSLGLWILLAAHWGLVAKGFPLRWLLFGVLLLCGIYTFLLGGLHMKEFQTEPVDPLCYWLAAGGLAFLGMGGYTAYSPELDLHFKDLRKGRLPD